MSKEEKLVVNPLEEYFRDSERCGATWTIVDKAKERSETGWDLQVARKPNLVLLIEAKFLNCPFASALAFLVMASLSKRRQTRNGSAFTCWAIGDGRGRRRSNRRTIEKPDMGRVYQNLFDYFARNPKFWKCYSKTLKVKYIFFVHFGKVAKISFIKMVNLAEQYRNLSLPKSKSQRDSEAEKIIGNLIFK